MTTEQMDEIDDTNENGPKALRDALAKQKAENEALTKSLKELRAQVREREIKDRGLSPKVTKFIPEDANLEEWLQENADVFGITLEAPKEQDKQAEGVQSTDEHTKPLHPLQGQFANLHGAEAGAQAPSTGVDNEAALKALSEGGLEAYENYLRSQTGRV